MFVEIAIKMRLLYVKGREWKYDATYHQGCFLLVGAFRCLAPRSKRLFFFFFFAFA